MKFKIKFKETPLIIWTVLAFCLGFLVFEIEMQGYTNLADY